MAAELTAVNPQEAILTPSVITKPIYEVVEQLPTENIKTSVIYCVPKENPTANDAYDMWGYVNGEWEKVDGGESGDFVPVTRTIAGIDLQDDITEQELKTALGLSDNCKIFKNTYAPPYYVKSYNYCNEGDVWIDMTSGTSSFGYRISVLLYKSWVSTRQIWFYYWVAIVPSKNNLSSFPSGGSLPIRNYGGGGDGTERSYPNYRNKDIIVVNDSEYEVSVSHGDGGYTYTYSFVRKPSASDTYTKSEIDSMIGDIGTALDSLNADLAEV